MSTAPSEEHADIQALIFFGYGHLPAARFLLAKVQSGTEAARWLADLAESRITRVGSKSDQALNVALTASGLQELGLPPELLNQFQREFLEGMVKPHRQRVLGDIGPNAPDQWDWGAKGENVHLVLLLYAKTPEELARFAKEMESEAAEHGVIIDHRLEATALKNQREHFGFRDGMAQPVPFPRKKKPGHAGDRTAAGEFLFGYPDNNGDIPRGTVAIPADKSRELDGNENPLDSFTRNGSHLVLRQMNQDVAGFWNYLREQSKQAANPDFEAIRLASKMVGRWPDGVPLTIDAERSPTTDWTANPTSGNAWFAFRENDKEGHRCPVGAHIRRANPRDSLFNDGKTAQKLANRHRILRRGRPFGQPVEPNIYPDGIKVEALDGFESDRGDRGLYFLCFNVDLARQFEFIQQSWCNHPKFDELYDEPDPLIGVVKDPALRGNFSIPGKPIRQRLRDIPPFITVRGGAYFFMPSIRALKFLGKLASNE